MKLVGSVDLNPPRRRPFRTLLIALVALVIIYLAFWPTPVDPVAWTAPAATQRIGALQPNTRLAKAEWMLRGQGVGPESIAVDPQGSLVTGYLDGRIVRFSTDGKKVEQLANTLGRPLGLAFDKAGELWVADAHRGLLRVVNGKVEVMATEQGGVPFRFTNDLEIATDGSVYFTDASSRYGLEQFTEDLIEHRGSGRLLVYRPDKKQTELLLGDLRFANGLALAPDHQSVLINEMGAYQVIRYWIAGPNKGQHEIFASGLPGFPDNLTYSKERQRYWVAIVSPRDPIIDLLSNWPRLRKIIARLPPALRPKAKRHAQAIALDLQGKIVESLEDDSLESYSPLSSVLESKGVLYLGSFQRDAVAKLPAP